MNAFRFFPAILLALVISIDQLWGKNDTAWSNKISQAYLQLQMQSKRLLAIDLTNSLRSIHGNLISTINSAKMGTQRLINYGSCVIPDEYYRSACRDMMREDERLLLAVGEIFNRQDVTVDMVSIYF